MAIGTTAAILGSAALGAGGSLIASRNNSRAISDATNATTQSNADTLRFLRETRDQNNQLLAPFREIELNRGNFWNEIMGYDNVSGNFGGGGQAGGGPGGFNGYGGNSTGGPGTNFGTGPNGGGGRNVNPLFNTGGGGGMINAPGLPGGSFLPNTNNPDPVTTPVNTRGTMTELTGGGEGFQRPGGGADYALPNASQMTQGQLQPQASGGQPPAMGGVPATGGGSMQQQMVPDGQGGFLPATGNMGGGALNGGQTVGSDVRGADRFNNSLFNALYRNDFNRERDRVDQNLAGSGLLFSGARMNAVENARANTFQNALTSFLNFGTQGIATPATNSTISNSNNFGSQYAGINASNANMRGNAAIANANNNNALLGNLGNIFGYTVGALG